MKVAVVGAGTMGNGIAQVFAQNGHDVVLRDLDGAILDRALAGIAKSLAKLEEKGKLEPGTKDEALGRIRPETDLEAVRDAGLVVEAIVENADVKRTLFKQLDLLAPTQAILASNTSSISITRLGAATKRPGKVVGMHFMNPVPLMQLV